MNKNITTIIIGKRSFLSKNLIMKIPNSKIFSINEILKKKNFKLKYKIINIIYNHSYPLSKLNLSIDYNEIINQNILCLCKFLKFILKNELKIKTFIFSSSAAVYNLEENKKNFNFFDNNRNLYGASKFLAERLLIAQKKQLNYNIVIMRIFNIFGPNENRSLIGKIINLKEKRKKINVYSNQKSFRDFIHINDVVEIYKKFLIRKESGIYDVGSGISTNIKKLIDSFFKKNDQKILKNINFDEQRYSKANLKKLQASIGKISFINVNKFLNDELNS